MRLATIAILLAFLHGGSAHALPTGAKVVAKGGVKVTTWERKGEHVTHEAWTDDKGARVFKLSTQRGMLTTKRTVRVDTNGKTTVDHESVEAFNAGGSHTKRLHRVVRGGDAKENSFSTETQAGAGMDFVFDTEHVQGGVGHSVRRINGMKVHDKKARREVPESWQAAQAE